MAKSRVIGLDIGTTHVRAAEIEFGSGGPARTAQPTLLHYGSVQLPLGAVRDGEVAETETVASAIRQLWTEARFSSREVVLGVGNQRVMVRDLELPAMPMAQIRASLPYQVQDMLPVAVDDALLDYVPTGTYLGEHGEVVQGLLVAATKETVQANTAAVETAGLRPLMVDLTAFALARIMGRGLTGRTVALVDIGARITTVVIMADGRPRFVRLLPAGGQDVTDAVASAMSVSAQDAEGIKRQASAGHAMTPGLAPAVEAIQQVSTSLVDSIRNTFLYYAGSHPGSPADSVLLTGGGAHLLGLGQFLASASRLPVSLGQPLASLKVGRSAALSESVQSEQQTLAVPLGLAFGVAA